MKKRSTGSSPRFTWKQVLLKDLSISCWWVRICDTIQGVSLRAGLQTQEETETRVRSTKTRQTLVIRLKTFLRTTKWSMPTTILILLCCKVFRKIISKTNLRPYQVFLMNHRNGTTLPQPPQSTL